MSRCDICGSKSDCDEFCGDSFSDMRDSVLFSREVIEDLKAENEKLRECVEFYADWENECCGDYRPPNRARQTLKELEGEK